MGQAQASAYYGEYLRLVQIDDITNIYLEFKGDVSYFVELCKAAKAANISIPEVIKLLKIANNYLPSVEHRYEVLQRQNNMLESILRSKGGQIHNLNGQIRDTGKSLDAIKSECRREAAVLQGLQQQAAKLEAFVYNYKNNNEEYIKVIKSIENKVHDLFDYY